jgi:hypothetical protein
MNRTYYILDEKQVKEVSLTEWIDCTEKGGKIRRNNICGCTVSTVFVGTPNIMFETMIFGGEHNKYQKRYETYDEAIIGHQKACELVSKRNTKLDRIL